MAEVISARIAKAFADNAQLTPLGFAVSKGARPEKVAEGLKEFITSLPENLQGDLSQFAPIVKKEMQKSSNFL